jgi:hypothetical protein
MKIKWNILVIKCFVLISAVLFENNLLAQNLPSDTTFFNGAIDMNFVSSKYPNLYANVLNVLKIRLPHINPGKIFLKPMADTSDIKLTTTFFTNDNGWYFELSESARKTIPDNGEIKFAIIPRKVKNIMFDLFVDDSLTSIHYARFPIEVVELPGPELTIKNFNNRKVRKDSILYALKDIRVTNLSMYLFAEKLYGVNHILVKIFDNKGKLTFQDVSYANYITSVIQKAILKCKKGDRLDVSLSSKTFKYSPITIIVDK